MRRVTFVQRSKKGLKKVAGGEIDVERESSWWATSGRARIWWSLLEEKCRWDQRRQRERTDGWRRLLKREREGT